MTFISFTKSICRRASSLLIIVALTLTCSAFAEESEFDFGLRDIQQRWAVANYRVNGKEQKEAFEALMADSRAFSESNPNRAEALVWQGIVASTYAGVKGPFGAMSLANEARDALHKAEAMNPSVLDGSVYTSLGALYYKVPGGIIGFGDKEKARDYLQKALALNPGGIDPNFFYGELMFELKDYQHAHDYLVRAEQASPRAGRAVADEGRKGEIASLLARADKKLR